MVMSSAPRPTLEVPEEEEERAEEEDEKDEDEDGPVTVDVALGRVEFGRFDEREDNKVISFEWRVEGERWPPGKLARGTSVSTFETTVHHWETRVGEVLHWVRGG